MGRSLTDVEKTMIDIAGKGLQGGREAEELQRATGTTVGRAYQLLNRLLGEPAAWEYAPATMGLLERRRTTRSRIRSVRRSATSAA